MASAHSQFSDWVAICQWSGLGHVNYHSSASTATDEWGCSGTAKSVQLYTQFIGSSGTFETCTRSWYSAPPVGCYTSDSRIEEA